jgi:hypothetical protein
VSRDFNALLQILRAWIDNVCISFVLLFYKSLIAITGPFNPQIIVNYTTQI